MDVNGIKVLVDLLTLAHLHTTRAVVPFQVMCRFEYSLRSKRFQSSYCAKVRAEAKKKVPSPSPVINFFCSCPSFLDEPHEETLATQASLNKFYIFFSSNKKSYFFLSCSVTGCS